MPELPEVEIARQNLERWFANRKIVSSGAPATRIFRGGDRKAFGEIRGRLVSASRRGKYLMLSFENRRGLLAHLGMTGKFVRRGTREERFSRAHFQLDTGEVIHFRDPRMFGRIEPCDSGSFENLPSIAKLGPDPLVDGLDSKSLQQAIGSSKQDLKVALMDQSRLAGLGNIHAAEALYRAKLHPALKPSALDEAAWGRLAKAINLQLRFAIDQEQGDEIEYVEEPGAKNPFSVYGRADQKCRRCRKPIASIRQGGRTTYFCTGCQQTPVGRAGKSTTLGPKVRAKTAFKRK